MNLWVRASAIFSVIVLILFGITLYKIEYGTYKPESQYLNPIELAFPRINNLLDNMPKGQEPFRQKFFENVNFKGLIKTKANNWAGVFEKPNGALIYLAEGDKFEGVTIKYADKFSCIVRFGNTERKFLVR